MNKDNNSSRFNVERHNGEGMQKNHNVHIERHPGATTLDIMDHVKSVIRKKPDLIIIHAGTNDLTCKEEIDTVVNLSSIIEEARRVSPETKITLSSIVVRKDKQAMEKKVNVAQINNRIKDLIKQNEIQVMDNSTQRAIEERNCI